MCLKNNYLSLHPKENPSIHSGAIVGDQKAYSSVRLIMACSSVAPHQSKFSVNSNSIQIYPMKNSLHKNAFKQVISESNNQRYYFYRRVEMHLCNNPNFRSSVIASTLI